MLTTVMRKIRRTNKLYILEYLRTGIFIKCFYSRTINFGCLRTGIFNRCSYLRTGTFIEMFLFKNSSQLFKNSRGFPSVASAEAN